MPCHRVVGAKASDRLLGCQDLSEVRYGQVHILGWADFFPLGPSDRIAAAETPAVTRLEHQANRIPSVLCFDQPDQQNSHQVSKSPPSFFLSACFLWLSRLATPAHVATTTTGPSASASAEISCPLGCGQCLLNKARIRFLGSSNKRFSEISAALG